MRLGIVLREALQGLGRNITMTIALVITTAISLALLATGILVTNMTERTKDIYLDRVETIVQFDDDISANDPTCESDACKEVREALDGAEGVESVTFRSRSDSYQRFVELFKDTDPQLVESTSEDALPAALHVQLTDPLDDSPLDPIRDKDQVIAIIDQNDDVRAATDNLDSIRNATFLIAAVQAVAAVFLIANMVQLAAYHRREETKIMRIVGASRWYTQAPFIMEAVFAAFIGSVLAVAGLFAGKKLVVDQALSDLYSSHIIAPVLDQHVWVLAPVIALIGVGFAAITADVTLRLYVRK
ncbi:Cell division protein FtsX [Corynebacterium ciconiae DSM 44920]|uniref:permease-like cell division protein FtsX n=1 Tax=Corynebacterium ciconiae TaxID=227319 RepID=UPI000381D9BC|nr:permease-like cell division protein FtsX [Corynebacterium ciconiae]WKD61750.1 Cell division protein FtsX [Corynebacterium ciconiae DSM 44920]